MQIKALVNGNEVLVTVKNTYMSGVANEVKMFEGITSFNGQEVVVVVEESAVIKVMKQEKVKAPKVKLQKSATFEQTWDFGKDKQKNVRDLTYTLTFEMNASQVVAVEKLINEYFGGMIECELTSVEELNNGQEEWVVWIDPEAYKEDNGKKKYAEFKEALKGIK